MKERSAWGLTAVLLLLVGFGPAGPAAMATTPHRTGVTHGAPDGPIAGPAQARAPSAAACPADALLCEDFEDTAFDARGWYDGPRGTLTTDTRGEGSTHALECTFQEGARGCAGGTPARHLFAPISSVYIEYWVRYGAGFVGSGRPYHPHEFNLLTDKDGAYIGPAGTHLTTYVEQLAGVPRLALQDMLNVDTACILRNDDSFVGCNGDFASYPFTESRSVASCNGLAGDLDKRDCFQSDATHWYSARVWDAAPSANLYDERWHQVAALFRMNSVTGGKGVVDGALRYWLDGEPVISYDRILFRTAVNADMQFNQLLIAPYIGDGSPKTQTMYVDDLRLLPAGDGGRPAAPPAKAYAPFAAQRH